MSDGLNRCEFLGNLGADPELKVTQGGTAVLKLSLAVNSSYLDRDNNRQERTEWIRCTIFGKRAEGLAKHLSKGDRLYVAGEMRTNSYEKDGEKRYSTEVVVNEVVFAGGGRREGSNTGSSQQRPQGQQQGQQRSFDTGGGQRGGNGNGNGGQGGNSGQRSNGNGNGGGQRRDADDFGGDYYGGSDDIPF